MGSGGGSRQGRRKCRPMWYLRRQKIATVRFSMSVVFIFTNYNIDYFWKISWLILHS